MTEPVQSVLFEMPSAKRWRREPVTCHARGGWDDWIASALTQPKHLPYCDRVPGHLGPHRVYRARDAAVLAEW